ncbi:beta-N-acetylhexosaminidase [Chondrinema litorale]|uniref:beta-N-acetylhexosaminidase n=1 Tax=Chondrinema litorale TaxID=2994555 RepID=UPI00254307D2|nr:beta-N-acetylhexosaminidase [Chondrinema litorale]UZR96415.1 beta-N-acetylhexosaminidase [Chondrinema litorale]
MKLKNIINTLIIYCLITVSFIIKAQTTSSEGFKVKGFHLDLRIQVMTPEALKKFADELAEMGMNTLVMEWEGTYPFEKHPAISNKYSYSREEVKEFVSYCDNLGIKVIPLQQSLGHVEYILRNTRYSHLKEDRKDISQICPMKITESKALFTDLFSDLAAMHNSEYIHIGGDETYLLGHCELCQKKVAEEGKSKLFVDHMKMIAEIVISLGKKPVMWADIILKHPEAADELPKETIFVDWNYGWKINHFGDIPDLQAKGFTFWGAPSIRSHPDNWYVTDWPKHFENQREFIPYPRKAGYKGLIMTSWSTSGLYGFTWDVGYDVMGMVQIRNTYPMSGFNILIACYGEAIKTKEPIDTDKFILDYAANQFGLNQKDTETLLAFLSVPPELIVNGKPQKSESVEQMQQDFGKIRDQINDIQPKKHQSEFAHFKLMADLRMHYLDFKGVEAKYNADSFTIAQTSELVSELEKILKDAKALNRRFTALNKGFLYDTEIEHQNQLRVMPIQLLYDRLMKVK